MPDEPLQVNPDRLNQAVNEMSELLGKIPQIPAAAPVSGSDPLSAAIAAKIPELERPVTGV